MEAPPGSAPEPRDVRYVVRTRRGLPKKTLAAFLVLALLLGRGLGWFGSGDVKGTSEQAPAGNPSLAAVAADTPGKASPQTGRLAGGAGQADNPGGEAPHEAGGRAPAGTSETQPTESQPQATGTTPGTPAPAESTAMESEPQLPSAPMGESRAPETAAAPAAPRAPAVDPDRFGSLLALLQTCTSDRRLGSALSCLQRLRELPLDAAQQTALVQPSAELENALANACSGIVKSLCDGEVQNAAAAVEVLLHDERALVLPVLAQSLALCGLHGDLEAAVAPGSTPWPQPKPIAKGRSVRTRQGHEVLIGRVIDSRAERVTLRVQRGQAVTFPTVPMVDCEPTDVTPAEAVEMALAALHAGKLVAARLWLGCAQLRSGEPAEAVRQERLQQLLR